MRSKPSLSHTASSRRERRSMELVFQLATIPLFATLSTDRARGAGLVLRDLSQTLADVLAYEERRSCPRQAGLSDQDERRVRQALSGDG